MGVFQPVPSPEAEWLAHPRRGHLTYCLVQRHRYRYTVRITLCHTWLTSCCRPPESTGAHLTTGWHCRATGQSTPPGPPRRTPAPVVAGHTTLDDTTSPPLSFFFGIANQRAPNPSTPAEQLTVTTLNTAILHRKGPQDYQPPNGDSQLRLCDNLRLPSLSDLKPRASAVGGFLGPRWCISLLCISAPNRGATCMF